VLAVLRYKRLALDLLAMETLEAKAAILTQRMVLVVVEELVPLALMEHQELVVMEALG
jgi:hypothetical protein